MSPLRRLRIASSGEVVSSRQAQDFHGLRARQLLAIGVEFWNFNNHAAR